MTSKVSRKWKPGQKEKFIATMKAKRLANEHQSKTSHKKSATKLNSHHDAIIFLRKAQREVIKQIAQGKIKQIDSVQLYTLLALNSLEEGGE